MLALDEVGVTLGHSPSRLVTHRIEVCVLLCRPSAKSGHVQSGGHRAEKTLTVPAAVTPLSGLPKALSTFPRRG